MLVSYTWLKDYVDIDTDPQELADKLTMVGLEVSSVRRLGPELDGVVVGYVEHVEPHPHSDKLFLCRVNVGRNQALSIVCGAPNVAAGQKVPVAMVGTSLPTGQKIEKAVIRKVESEGMICSGDELGLDSSLLPKDQQEGIMVLPHDSEIGATVESALNLDDTIFEIDLTPNRADCMSIRNIAREVAAIEGVPLKPLEIDFEESSEASTKDMISVEIKDADLCGRYVARAVTGVAIGPSPAWMQNRLRAVGVRPINNIVDVTNFVMMELGQPLHAFDYDFLEEKTIVVRRAEKGEKIITLDGQERQLTEDTLVIADGKRPVAIAGIMGGENSEIMEDTTTVLIESANFNLVNIRRSSKRLGLRSESSMRFEKGVNIEGARQAADRAAQLMASLGGGRVVSGLVDNYPRKWTPVKIELNIKKVNNLLDLDLSKEKIIDLLQSIELTCEDLGQDSLLVTVPSFRLDIERDIDLVEEVARLYGYEKIPLTIPEGDVSQEKMTWEKRLENKCKEILTGCGLTEVISYSFLNPKSFDKIGLPESHFMRNTVKISNPLSEEQSEMRTTVIPNLLEIAQRNASRKVMDLCIFEFGRVFFPGKESEELTESPVLSGLAMGSIPGGWKWDKEELDFFFLKGVLEELMDRLNIKERTWEQHTFPCFHPGRCARLTSKGKVIGMLGEIHPDVLENYELSSRACAFELDFTVMAALASDEKQYTPLQRYPSAERDLAIIVSEDVSAAQLAETIEHVGGDILAECRLFDIYRGKQIPRDKKSMAYSLIYRSPERTLTDEEVNNKHEEIKQKLVEKFSAELR